MKNLNSYHYIVILLFFSLEVHCQIVTTPNGNPNPTISQTLCGYKFLKSPGTRFEEWVFEQQSNNCSIFNQSGVPNYYGIFDSIVYIKWHNVEANARSMIFKAQFFQNGYRQWTEVPVGPFTLNMPAPSFSCGTSLTISNGTSPVTISLNPYINTVNNGYDQGLTITSHFEWTLPSGWHTSSNESGTFVSGSSIVVIPTSAICPETISVKAYANGQKSNPATLEINRYIPIEGPEIICSSGATYIISNPPTGSSFQWSAGPNLSISSGQNTSSCTFTSSGSGNSYVSATLTTSCGNITLPSKNVWIGIPPYPVITSGAPYEWSSAYGNTPAKVFTLIGPDISLNDENYYNSFANSFTWDWSSDNVPTIYNIGYGEILFMPSATGVVRIRTRVSNSCGETELSACVFVVVTEGFLMSPNPASDNLTIITENEQQIAKLDAPSISPLTKFNVRIFSFAGIKRYESAFYGKNFTIPVGNLREGNYFVEVSNGKNIYRKQLIIKR